MTVRGSSIARSVRVACSALCLIAPAFTAIEAVAGEPVPAGGLLFALQPSLKIESAELQIGVTSVRHTYRVRNSGKTTRTMLVTFALPEIDRFSFSDGGGLDAARDPINIVGATSIVDGQAAILRAQQRAYALGLDVTSALAQAKLSLLPIDAQLDSQIAALPTDTVNDFVERGILQFDDGKLQPGWSLQTTGHWRQSLSASSVVIVEHAYTPMMGIQPLSEQSILRAIDRGCLSALAADSLRRRMNEPDPPQMTTIVVQTGTVAGQEPASRVRVQIDVPDGALVATSCLEPQQRPDARTIIWSQQATGLDQDVVVVIVK